MRRIRSEKISILIILLLVSSFVMFLSYARYSSESNSSDQIRVANSGKLTLIEKINGEIQINNSNDVSNASYDITSGGVIDKEVYIEFIDTEVSTYLFLVIDNNNWSYDALSKKVSIENNKSKLLSFDINNIWNFCEEASSKDKLVYYHLVDVNDDTDNNKYDVMNQIDIGLITIEDKEKINNSSLRFSAYSIQKNGDDSAIEAWNYLNL